MKSIWNESCNINNYEELKNDINVDVVIIGAGITGLSCGYYLSKEKLNVCILEKDKILSGTSSNTTGKITAGHGLIYKYLLDDFGKEYAKKYYNANKEAIKNIKKIIEEEKIECDFEEKDSYVFATQKLEAERIKLEIEALNELNIKAEFVDKLDIPIENYGGVKLEKQAQFNINKYAKGLTKAITKNNCKIYENSTVYEINKEKNEYKIVVNNNIVKAKYVVIATRYPIKNFPGFYFTKMYQSNSYAIAIDTKEKNPEGMYISSIEPTISLRTAVDNNKKELLILVRTRLQNWRK